MTKLADSFRREYRKTRRDVSFKTWLAAHPEKEKVAAYLKNKGIARGAARVMRKDKPIYVKSRKKKAAKPVKAEK